MSPVEVDLLDGALVIAPERVPAALAALADACKVAPGQSVEALRGIGFTVGHHSGAVGPLIVNEFRGRLDGAADAAVAALARFVDDGTTLLWEDDNGERWRYLINAGQVIEQAPAALWRNVNDRTTRTGGVLTPLTISRDDAGFARWWANVSNRDEIIEILESLAGPDCDGVEYSLHSLMLAVFQGDTDAAHWLHVAGLREGVTPSYLCLDIDVAHDGEGLLDGVEVVLSLQTAPPCMSLTVSAYIDRPRRVLVPESGDAAEAALAAMIDTALELVNEALDARDRFTFGARDVLMP